MDLDERRRLEEIAERFDAADDYDRHYQRFFGTLVAAEVRAKDVLELGCSSGVMSAILLEHVRSLHMVDGSATYIERAQAKLPSPKARFTVALFEDFDPQRSFDAIVCSHVLEHVADPVAMLQRARRWLTPDGVLYAYVPNAYSVHRLLGVAMGLSESVFTMSERDRLVGHRRVYTPQTLADDLRAAGLEPGELRGVNLKPFPNAQMVGLSDALVEGLLRVGTQIPHNAADIFYACRLPEFAA